MSKSRKNPTKLKLSPITRSMIGIQITGNITPPTWYDYIIKPETPKKKGNRADMIAIPILSDIWYWCTPTEIRDKRTGKVLGHEDKFDDDMLQRSYQYYMDMFSLGKDQVRLAINNLIRLNLIRKEQRDITTKKGLVLTGVLYYEPIVENVLKITYPWDYNYNINILEDPPEKNQGGPRKKSGGSLKKIRGVPEKNQTIQRLL